jgi:hypothetical protein
MNWIEVTDPKQLPYTSERVLVQDQYGNMGVVYWNSYDWVYDIDMSYRDMDEIILPGKIIKYLILD